MDKNIEFGKRLKAIRKKNNIMREELAEDEILCSEKTLARLEQGIICQQLMHYINLEEFCGISLYELYYGVKLPEQKEQDNKNM